MNKRIRAELVSFEFHQTCCVVDTNRIFFSWSSWVNTNTWTKALVEKSECICLAKFRLCWMIIYGRGTSGVMEVTWKWDIARKEAGKGH